jgi:hypothetical protein
MDLERSINTLRGDVQSMLQRQQLSIMQNITQNETTATDTGTAHNNWGIWNWNDGLIGHYVPHGWNFPHGITLKALWDLWFFGNKAENIRPYRLISKEHDIKAADKMHYSRAFKAIEFTEALIRQYRDPQSNAKLIDDNVRTHCLNQTDSDRIFDAIYVHMMILLYGTANGRKEELSYGGVYNLITKRNINNQVKKRRRLH